MPPRTPTLRRLPDAGRWTRTTQGVSRLVQLCQGYLGSDARTSVDAGNLCEVCVDEVLRLCVVHENTGFSPELLYLNQILLQE
ncbi:hypothetical protein BaRGS_00006420 [Batillaria attramentaria]|uniref:Saposin B-type domain-containing protein n=1 Tax=Batillaria attramentaria TaxID=370345 RepID=A0ABD0LU47_9CAEN